MYYTRQFQSGDPHDVRSKLWGEFKCDACGKIECVEIKQPALFRYDKIITCPRCGATGKADQVKALEAKKQILEQEHKKIQAEIETIIAELDRLKEVPTK